MLINKLLDLSKEVYSNLGGGNFDEKDYQKALGFELLDNNISYLREFHVEIFYKDHPIKLGAPDFYLDQSDPKCFLELKLSSGLDDTNRHQMYMYLKSVDKNNNKVLKEVKDGYLINFLKVEPLYQYSGKKPKGYNKIEIEHYKLNMDSNLELIQRIEDQVNFDE